jgi:hypothetical protein
LVLHGPNKVSVLPKPWHCETDGLATTSCRRCGLKTSRRLARVGNAEFRLVVLRPAAEATSRCTSVGFKSRIFSKHHPPMSWNRIGECGIYIRNRLPYVAISQVFKTWL